MKKTQKSVYIDPALWQRAKSKTSKASLSYVITRLLEMWLNGEVKIIVEPIND